MILLSTKPRGVVTLAVSIASFLILSGAQTAGFDAVGAPIVRMTIWAPQDRHSEVALQFDQKLIPLLARHGLLPLDVTDQTGAPDVFHRDLRYTETRPFAETLHAINHDDAWMRAIRNLESQVGSITSFGTDYDDDSRHTFTLIQAPAGNGFSRALGPGRSHTIRPQTGHWATYGVTDGLSGSTILAIEQDRHGRLWLGTETGVTTYDGRGWQRITTADGLADNHVTDVLQTRDGDMWFATKGGLTRFDGEAWRNYRPPESPDGQVRAVVEDADGVVWFGGVSFGVQRLDPGRENPVAVLTREDGLTGHQIYDLLADRAGRLWIGTDQGLGLYEGDSLRVLTVTEGLPSNVVQRFCEDDDGRVWVGTNGGLCYYTGQVERSHFARPSVEDPELSGSIRSLHVDDRGTMWVGTREGLRFRSENTWGVLTEGDELPDEAVTAIFEDNEGHLWLGTYRGVVRYDGQTYMSLTTGDGLPHDMVNTIGEDATGAIWVGTRRGVCRIDSTVCTTYSDAEGILDGDVWGLASDDVGRVWFGMSDRGLYRIEGDGVRRYAAGDGLPDLDVRDIWPVGDGILFGTFRGRSLTRWIDGVKSVSRLIQSQNPSGVTVPRKVWTVMVDSTGKEWVGTHGGGVIVFDGDNATRYGTEDGLAHDEVRVIREDRNGRIWFGTLAGVTRYDPVTGAWTTFTHRDGMAHVDIRAILETDDGHLWFGTRGGGVTRYDGEAFTTMTREDGLVSDQVLSLHQDSRGDVWIGTGVGLTRYRQPKGVPPSVRITSVIGDEVYGEVSELALPSSVSAVRISFEGLSLKTRPEALQFKYRLLGYDDEWHITKDRFVEYRGLSAADLTFEILAIDRDLVSSETPAVLRLTVIPNYLQGLVWTLFAVAVALTIWQSARLLRRGRDLRASYADLSRSHDLLEREKGERERVEVERVRLDEQVQQLDYLSRLRQELSEVRSTSDAIVRTGETLIDALSGTAVGGLVIRCDTKEWRFGTAPDEAVEYGRSLSWGGSERGHLILSSSVRLRPSQECALLDATAGQLSRSLEAQELNSQLLQSARLVSMGQVAAGVAHELNQPLGAIAITAGDVHSRLIEDLDLPKEQLKSMMSDVVRLTERMSTTVNQLRMLSRDTSAAPYEPFSMNDVVHNSVRILEAQLANHEIRLTIDLDADLPPVLGRGEQIEQVLLNLLANARDAVDDKDRTREPGAQRYEKIVQIRTRRRNGRIDLEVEDNGVGMSEETVERVFEPFYTTKSAEEGTGLGMSISYAIVRSHGGRITCESTSGSGTIFRMSIALEAEKPQTEDD